MGRLPEMKPFEDVVAEYGPVVLRVCRAVLGPVEAAVADHYLAGLSYADIAELLDNNEAAARRAAADGINRLRATCRKEVG